MTEPVFVCRHVFHGEKVKYVGNLEGYLLASCSCGEHFHGEGLSMDAQMVSSDFIASDKDVGAILKMLPIDCAAFLDDNDCWRFYHLEGADAEIESDEYADDTLYCPSKKVFYDLVGGKGLFCLEHEDGVIATMRYNSIGMSYLPVYSSKDEAFEAACSFDLELFVKRIDNLVLNTIPERVRFANLDDGSFRHRVVVPLNYISDQIQSL